MRLARVLLTSLTTVALALTAAGPAAARRPASPPPVGHVFVIVLENEDAATTFGPDSPAPYLAQTLTAAQGAFVPGYYGIGAQLARATTSRWSAARRPTRRRRPTARSSPTSSAGTAGRRRAGRRPGLRLSRRGEDRRRPARRRGPELEGLHGGHGRRPRARHGTTCAHPAIGAPRRHAAARRPSDQYATRHNPFVYFHSIIDRRRPLRRARRPADARWPATSQRRARRRTCPSSRPTSATTATTPPAPTAARAGWPAADAFLRTWVPRIIALAGVPARRPARRSPSTRPRATRAPAAASSPGRTCRPAPGTAGPGGGRTGAVLLLAASSRRGTSRRSSLQPLQPAAQHRGLVRRSPHLGYAGAPGLRPFGDDIYTAVTMTHADRCPAVPPPLHRRRGHDRRRAGRRRPRRARRAARPRPRAATDTRLRPRRRRDDGEPLLRPPPRLAAAAPTAGRPG